MTRDELVRFLRQHIVVQATATTDGAPQAAVIGIATSDALEIVFDTLETTRKYANLRADPRIALVIGWDEVTAQIEAPTRSSPRTTRRSTSTCTRPPD
jgi:pyridoxine/pyridoxamine 5'-phosphate oxidase